VVEIGAGSPWPVKVSGGLPVVAPKASKLVASCRHTSKLPYGRQHIVPLPFCSANVNTRSAFAYGSGRKRTL
jgi:hypothetical protein